MHFLHTIRTHSALTIVVVGIALSGAVLFSQYLHAFFASHTTAHVFYLKQAHAQLLPDSYDLQGAVASLEKVLALDPENAEAAYLLVHAYTVAGQYTDALVLAELYRDSHPDDTRISYLAGLAAGKTGAYDKAVAYFSEYIDTNATSGWASRLDLSWALFQAGKIDDADMILRGAVSQFGENAWLLGSLGGVLVHQGKHVEAQEILKSAASLASSLEKEDIRKKYRLNNPARDEDRISAIGETIAHNLALAEGRVGDAQVAVADPRYAFAGSSPDGELFGVVLSACEEGCTATSGQACVATNACGMSYNSTYECNGICDATVGLPDDFNYDCAVASNCGDALGIVGCNGQCNIHTYPDEDACPNDDLLVLSNNYRVTGTSARAGTSGYGAAILGLDISARPILVRKGTKSVVMWTSNEMVSCEVTSSTSSEKWTGLNGQKETPNLQSETKYTLTCRSFDGRTFTDVVTVRIVPVTQEI